MFRFTLIFLGGGVGSLLRYLIAGWTQRTSDVSFPLGTFVVNVAGSLIIGFLAATLTGPILIRDDYRIGLMVGVLGGFTTFSSFSLETLMLANDGQIGLALLNVALSVTICLAAAWLGYRIGEYSFGV
ncbi:MAG: fluoride efflux transporter CrcB [Candidatus Hydrogenedentales bacterium]|jgi:CrcB protein